MRKEKGPHGTNPVQATQQIRCPVCLLGSLGEGSSLFLKLFIDPPASQEGQSLDACRHGQRIAGEGTRLVRRPQWSNMFHDLTTPPIGTNR